MEVISSQSFAALDRIPTLCHRKASSWDKLEDYLALLTHIASASALVVRGW